MYYRTGWGCGKEFFNGIDSRNYFASFYSKMETEVEQMSDAEIVSCNFEEWADYLATKYSVAPISIFETNIEKTLSETKVKRANPFRGYPGERDYFEIDGVQVRFKIPFDGDPSLFELQPSSRILSRFATQSFVSPHDEDCGSFTLDFEYTKQELQDKGDAMAEYVQKQFENEFSSYKTMIGNVNAEVTSFNSGLTASAMSLLEKRKKKADSFSAISNALQIPLTASKNAPNTKPIQLKRIVRQSSAKPTVKTAIPEPCISDSDYENINNIILMCGTTMEKTARTYFANTEEELRDHLLATLNTHYESATGETFRKIGKTDIHIEFENKAAFIGECKIWHGERLFQGAIQQVINYSTWRDMKVSVIIFNKENQSFPAIISKKTALFLIMSDTDSTFNFVIAILQSQLTNLLCDKADDVYGGRLPVHVRFILDEFANIGQIPQFDKLIATIRSREISASIILQSQSQLKAIYKDNADTIVGNCDTMLFLGGKEKTTLKEISEILGKETIDSFNTSENRGKEISHGLNYQKLGKELMTQDEIATMDGGMCILQLRGVRPFFSKKYDITKHPRYKYLSDADKKNTFDVERYIRVQRKKKKHPSAVIAPEEPFDLYEIELSDEDADFTVAE